MTNKPNAALRPPNPKSHPKAPASHTPSAARPRVPKAVAIAIVVGLIALIGVVAVVASNGGSKKAAATTEATSVELGTVTTSGQPLAAFPDSGTDPAVGVVAPTLRSQTFSGADEVIEPGVAPMVVMFVAHWCPHCQREVPLVTKWLAASGMPTDVQLRAVATSTSATLPNYPPSAWLASVKFPITTIADDAAGTAANAYGLTAFPYFVALDRSGKVVKRTTGEISQADFEALIAAARTGKAPAA